jgi:hypothetical protein
VAVLDRADRGHEQRYPLSRHNPTERDDRSLPSESVQVRPQCVHGLVDEGDPRVGVLPASRRTEDHGPGVRIRDLSPGVDQLR